MILLLGAIALAAAQAAPAGSTDHSRHNPAQHAQHQQAQGAQHQQGQHQDHADMMKHCQAMMMKMHQSMHDGKDGKPSTHDGQQKHEPRR